MKRTIIEIDEQKCTGCEACVEGCHEGALQMIEGKARVISDLYCDGLGACIGECPTGAISLIEREAVPYDEVAVMERIAPKGMKTILAHLQHLKDHNERGYLEQGIAYLKEKGIDVASEFTTDATAKKTAVVSPAIAKSKPAFGGCPGSQSFSFGSPAPAARATDTGSQLRQWPVQLHLLNPLANYFQGADVLLAADCTAFAVGDFHSSYLQGKTLAIACPKLDSNKERYVEKLSAMIDASKINTLTVMIMEVPCCGELLRIAQKAVSGAERKIPIKLIKVGIQGNIIQNEWLV